MEQDLETSKTAARPSHEAIEDKIGTNTLTGHSEQQKMDQTAMKAATRAEHRIINNDQEIPSSTLFTK
jgi:hypothetical protein